MNRRNFLKILTALPFLDKFAAGLASAPPMPHRGTFTIKGFVTHRVREGERIKLLGTDEIFFVSSVTGSSDRFGNPVKVIKIDTF